MTPRPFLLTKFLHSKLRIETLAVELRPLGQIDTSLDRQSMELLSVELNLRLSQVTDSLMNSLQVQITRAINSAINDKLVPEIQNIMGTLSSGQRDTESGSSPNNQDKTEGTNGFISKITKKDSRSACNSRDTDDRSPYTRKRQEKCGQNEFKLSSQFLTE